MTRRVSELSLPLLPLVLAATTWLPAEAAPAATTTSSLERPRLAWVVGDSITRIGAPALRKRLASGVSQVEVNAVNSRPVGELDDRVRARLARGDRPDVMVLALGTNVSRGWGRDDYERVVEMIPAGIAIVLVTVYRSDIYPAVTLRRMARYSRWMRGIASERADVGVALWRRAASRRADQLLSDGVHPTGDGVRVWARLIGDAVDHTWARVTGARVTGTGPRPSSTGGSAQLAPRP